ncbi:hypothetical protein LWX53_05485 [bacterium]|nr:hypothetical protein [bacterium]
MYNKVLKCAVLVLSAAAIVLAFPGCDLLSGLFGGNKDGDPVTIPDSVAANAAYATLENDFITAINKERTDNGALALTRESSIDGLARRYSSAGKIDTGENLYDRIAAAYGSCTDACEFQFSSELTPNVTTAMTAWLSQGGATAAMRSASFTKVGIGIVTGPAPQGMPGTWIWVTALLVKP